MSVLLLLVFLAAPSVVPAKAEPYQADIAAAVDDVAGVYPVPPELVMAVIQRESAWKPRALSPVGAVGLMQVMPYNAARVGLTPKDLWIPRKNILAGTRLLAALLKHYSGDVISALVAYNARPRPRGAPVPQNGETPAYVRAVLRHYRAFLAARPVQASAPVAPSSRPSSPNTERSRSADGGAATAPRSSAALLPGARSLESPASVIPLPTTCLSSSRLPSHKWDGCTVTGGELDLSPRVIPDQESPR